MSDSVVGWSLRADLIRREIRMGRESYWVLQDPLSRQLQYVNSREYSLLELLDGRQTMLELIREARHRFAPDYLSGEAMVAFLADAKRRGLLVMTGTSGQVLPETTQLNLANRFTSQAKKWWMQPLAIRLPGINPDPLIDPWISRIRPLFTPQVGVSLLGLVLLAVGLVITQFGLFSEHVVVAASRHGHTWLLMVAIVVGATKIIHELAHAITCNVFGAECREMGMMFLVGIPCLYCDVSDAWMIPQRWKRIAVSAAGMAIELVIAAIATLLWWLSADGDVRDLCVTVMVVCSLNTILFNGNPLLRYDGYFILSDLTGIPNLGNRARAILGQAIGRVLCGSTTSTTADGRREDDWAVMRNRFLLAYGIASGLYRTIVLLSIAYVILRFADRQGLLPVASVIAVALVGGVATKRVVGLYKLATSPVKPRTWRPGFVAAMVCVIALAALLIPLPRTIVAPSMVSPAAAHPLYATVAGRVVFAVQYGEYVKQGQTIARLESLDAQNEYLRLQAERERLALELDGLQNRRSGDLLANAQIPAVDDALRSAERQLSLHQQQMDRLTIIAPVDGTVYAANDAHQEAVFVDEPMDPRESLPLSPAQRQSWIDAGTTLCVMGHPKNRELLLWVRQQDVPHLHHGQTVRLLLPDHPKETIRGRLTHIAAEPAESVDREFLVAGLIELKPGHEHEQNPRETYYQVRARLDEETDDLSVRLTARATVSVAPQSLLNRVTRWLHDAFRFQS